METHVSAAAPAKLPQPKRIKRYLILGGVAVLSYVAIFTVGYLRGRAELEVASQRNEQLSQRVEAIRKDFVAEHDRVLRLEARRCIDQAIGALDARNFGIAQQRLTEAGKLLAVTRVDGKLLEISKAIETYRVVATEDLGNQRQKLLELVTTFDQAYPAL